MRKLNTPVESSLFPGYYHCPVHETIVVSREGRVIDQRNLHCPIPVLGSSWPYLLINIWGYGTVTLHRIVALTFHKCLGDPDDYVVNHIDGDKLNCHEENLEWVTASENAIHAYVTGLRPDNRPVLSRDLESGDVEYYYSLQEASRRFGVNPSKVHRYLNSDSIIPWEKKFDLVYEDQPWKPLTTADVGKVVHGQPKDVVAIDPDGKMFIFGSASACARHFGINPGTIYFYLSNNGVAPSGLTVCYMEEFDGDLNDAKRIHYGRPKVERPNFRRKPVPVVIKDLSSGLETEWESVQSFAYSVGTNKNTIQKSMLVKDGRWRGYHIRYIKQDKSPPSETSE